MTDTPEETDNVVELSRSSLRSLMEDAGRNENAIPYSNDEIEKLNRLNKEYFYVENFYGSAMVCYWDTHHNELKDISPGDFAMTYSNETVIMDPVKGTFSELGRWWLKHADRREYKGVTFNPEKQERDSYGQLVDVGGKFINTYRGFGVKPIKGSWRLMIRHIHRVLCKKDKVRFKYVMRWLAWAVQNPGKPAQSCIVWQGKKGAGKGFLANTFKEIFGAHGQQISNRKQLTGQFNQHLERCCFLVADEAYYPGDKDVEGILKSIITEPTMQIEGKFQSARQVRNCLKIMMCTNNDWVIPASADERRFFIAEVSDEYTTTGDRNKIKDQYFSNLAEEIHNNGGKQAMLYHLLNMDLKGWHPRYDIPHTAELDKQIFEGLNFGQKCAYELLAEGVLPGNDRKKIKGSAFQEYMAKLVNKFDRCQPVQFSKALNALGIQKRRMSSGIAWVFPPLAEARNAFIKHFGSPPEPFEPDEKGREVWSFINSDNMEY